MLTAFCPLAGQPQTRQKHIQVAQDTTKTKSSLRILPLVPAFREKLLEVRDHQKECKRLCGKCYNKQYQEYICVDEMGNLISPHYLTSAFPKLLEKNGLRRIRFHDLRHPYVKYKAKNFLNFFAVPEPIVNCNYNPMLVC